MQGGAGTAGDRIWGELADEQPESSSQLPLGGGVERVLLSEEGEGSGSTGWGAEVSPTWLRSMA